MHSNGKVVWSDVPSTRQSFTEDDLISHVEYLIDNIYVNVGNKVYRQCVGIPMGTNCAPLLVNIFYEYQYMRGLLKNNIIKARKFNNTMRYIDDLLQCHLIRDIYPPELHLKRTTESTTALSYLDILTTIEHGKYSTTLHDKRDSFQFHIVNFPEMSSNIPSKPAYGVYISQLVRIGRIYSSYKTFHERHYNLTVKQGFRYMALCKAFKKFAINHLNIFSKYGCSVRRHVQDGICLPACDGFLSRYVFSHRGSCGTTA